jgi:von Willebrand factor type A domain
MSGTIVARWAGPLALGAMLVAACSSKKDAGFTDPSSSGGAFGDGNDAGLGASGGISILDGGCARATADAQRAPVYMQIVLDGSGSMGDDNKWAAVVPALTSIFDDLLAKNDPAFGVGLIAFADNLDPTCQTFQTPIGPIKGNCAGPYPSSVDVPIAFVDQGQHDKLRGRIVPSGPTGDTPTKSALTGGYNALQTFAPKAPLLSNGKKVLVLMTDGVPTDSSASEDASLVASELQKGITTFAVGIGPFPTTDPKSYDPAFMGQLAQAGGAAPPGCNPNEASNAANTCHFQVTPGGKSAQVLTQEFIDAINKIRSAVATCEFILTKDGAVDPSQVNVLYTDGGGTQHVLVQDGSNGWSYDNPQNPSKVILHGSDCDTVKADPKGKVEIVLGCATITK